MEELQFNQPKTKTIKTLFRNKKFLLILVIIFVLVIILIILFFIGRTPKQDVSLSTPTPEPTPNTLVANLINGLLVSPEIANRRAVAVMIENAPDARPQVGLEDADLVYEAYVEGNITRFMAFYSQIQPEKVGPVRSARSYYIDYLSEYDAVYVYSGGSPAALARINEFKIKNYPHSNDGTFWREQRIGLASEHTLFANIKKIFENSVTKKGWQSSYETRPWQFKDALTPATSTASTTIINYNGVTYKVEWIFDPTTNTYSRLMANIPHKDKISGKQITASTIIVMTIERAANPPYAGTNKESEWTMKTIGSGPVRIFQDGVEINGLWKKTSRTERTQFFDSTGKEIPLNRGKIWVQLIAPTTQVSIR